MTANTLAICVATMDPDSGYDVWTWSSQAVGAVPVWSWVNTSENNLGVVGAYQKLYEQHKEDILLFIHDDVICREPEWDLRLMAEFIADPQVALVGFGGALWHGLPELYKTPYRLEQLQRGDYRSNVDDAEVHGTRFTGRCNVAVLDGFALAVRRSFLDRIGGFAKISGCNFFNYDYALCALARRYKQKIRLIGVKCHHQGGATSVQHGKEPSVERYISQEAYDKSHEWFYNEFRLEMPARVKP